MTPEQYLRDNGWACRDGSTWYPVLIPRTECSMHDAITIQVARDIERLKFVLLHASDEDLEEIRRLVR